MFIKSLYIGLGVSSLALGIVGIFLPILPTVPFLLLAAWCFEKGSTRMHNWIVSHKYLGPPIVQWRKHGVIKTRAKVIAITLILASFSYVIFVKDTLMPVKVFLSFLGVGVISFISTRPSRVK